MIVNRHIWVVREGHTVEEAMEVFRERPSNTLQATRVLKNSGLVTQNSNTLIFEFEFDNLVSMAEQWREAGKDPRFGSFMDKWRSVCEANTHTADVWQIVE